MEPKASIIWTPTDIQTLRPEWTLEECEQWMASHRKCIVDRSVEFGWQVIQNLLDDSD